MRPTKSGAANKMLLGLMIQSVFGEMETEFRFHPNRKWRFDYAVPSIKLAVEYDGHGLTGRNRAANSHVGGHASLTGMSGDCEKINEAQRLGWRVVRFTALFFDVAKRQQFNLTAPLEVLEGFRNRSSALTEGAGARPR